MDNQGWIKLHRKLADHDILKDATSLQIFIWLLLNVDRQTGKYITGRFVAAQVLGMKPRTFHKALSERLQHRYDLVTLSSDNKKTIIYLKNWDKYQILSDTHSDTKVTTKGQQSDTKQEVRSKKILSKDNIAYGNEAINLILSEFEKLEGHKPTDPKPRFEAFNLLRNIKTTIKEVGHKEVTDEGIARVVVAYYGWLKKQEWGISVQNLSTVRRKFEIYKSILQRSTNETN